MSVKSRRIEAARAASDSIMNEVNQARERLAGPWFANGFGVFTDPGEVRADIRSAIERLNHALGTVEEAAWPQQGDYDDQ